MLEKSRKTMINFLKKTLTSVAQFHHIHCTRSEHRRLKERKECWKLVWFYFQKTRLTFKNDDCKFHKLRVNDSDVNNGSFKRSYKVTKRFLLLFGSAILRTTNYGNIAFAQGCLQYLKWNLHKGSFASFCFLFHCFFRQKSALVPGCLDKLKKF